MTRLEPEILSGTDAAPVAASPSVEVVAATPPRLSRPRWLAFNLEAAALPLVTLAVAAFFSLWPRTSDIFLTSANLQVLLGTQAVVAIVALGALVPLVAGEWDLSVGANASLVAVCAAQLMGGGYNIFVAFALCVLIGAAVGSVIALITTRLGVNGVITTLGIATILFGIINQRTAGLAVVSNIPTVLTDFGTGTWLGLPRTVLAVAAVAVAVYYLLGHTPFGRYLYAIGSNPSAANLVGIRVRLVMASAFVVTGVLAASGGFLSVARAGGATPSAVDALSLPALAAAFLSAASIRPGRYNVPGTLVAILFLAVINNGLNLAGAQPFVNNYVNGAALILGVALAAFLGRRASGRA